MEKTKAQEQTIRQRDAFQTAKAKRNGVVADNNYLRMMGRKARARMLERGESTKPAPLPELPPKPLKYVILDTDAYPRGEVYGVTKVAATQEAIDLLVWGDDEPCTHEAAEQGRLLPGWRLVLWGPWHSRVMKEAT